MNSDLLPSAVCRNGFLTLSPRRCRCHACRQRRAAELRRALECKFSRCSGLSRSFAPPVQTGATAQPLETAAR